MNRPNKENIQKIGLDNRKVWKTETVVRFSQKKKQFQRHILHFVPKDFSNKTSVAHFLKNNFLLSMVGK